MKKRNPDEQNFERKVINFGYDAPRECVKKSQKSTEKIKKVENAQPVFIFVGLADKLKACVLLLINIVNIDYTFVEFVNLCAF